MRWWKKFLRFFGIDPPPVVRSLESDEQSTEEISAYVEPVSSGPEEKEEIPCYDRFPAGGLPEIWLNVFDKLDRTDKLAFSGASQVWHELVEQKRTQSLFSEVAPYLIDTLPVKTSLQSRELCQSWKEELDHQNQTHPSKTSLDFEIAAAENWHPARRSRWFDNFFKYVENAEGFMEEMRSHPGNPFPGRSIIINFMHSDDQDQALDVVWSEYWTNIKLLLEKFGSHVHFAEISVYFDPDELEEVLEEDEVQIQVHLRDCIFRLPNLKQLCVHGEEVSPLPEDEIREYYRLNPLPRLEQLETLDMIWVTPTTVEAILNSCCVPANIKRLSYSHPLRCYESLGFCEAIYGFVNLEVLQATILLRHLARLASLERRPRLRELDLDFEDAPYFEDVFSVLELFAESLIQFRVSPTMRVRNDRENGEPFTCNLPNLERLYIVEYWGSPDLLFQFEAVTHLEIIRMMDFNGAVVDGFEEQMNDSDIWMMMPSLQNLTLGSKTYERQIVEQPALNSECGGRGLESVAGS